jgi:hypothetical protein
MHLHVYAWSQKGIIWETQAILPQPCSHKWINSHTKSIKVMLKAKFVQISFSQIHQNYVKYTFETFTVDGITIDYQIESMA